MILLHSVSTLRVLNCSVNVLLEVNSLWIGRITAIHPESSDIGGRFILCTNYDTPVPFCVLELQFGCVLSVLLLAKKKEEEILVSFNCSTLEHSRAQSFYAV